MGVAVHETEIEMQRQKQRPPSLMHGLNLSLVVGQDEAVYETDRAQRQTPPMHLTHGLNFPAVICQDEGGLCHMGVRLQLVYPHILLPVDEIPGS